MPAKNLHTLKKGLILVWLLPLLLACGKSPEENQFESKDPETREYIAKELGLQLDQGKPWKANPETTTGIKKMTRLVENFNSESGMEEYLELQSSLRASFDEIFRECSMEGEGHEQLHRFLIPMMDLFKDLGDEDQARRKEAFSKLEDQLPVYWDFFE